MKLILSDWVKKQNWSEWVDQCSDPEHFLHYRLAWQTKSRNQLDWPAWQTRKTDMQHAGQPSSLSSMLWSVCIFKDWCISLCLYINAASDSNKVCVCVGWRLIYVFFKIKRIQTVSIVRRDMVHLVEGSSFERNPNMGVSNCCMIGIPPLIWESLL